MADEIQQPTLAPTLVPTDEVPLSEEDAFQALQQELTGGPPSADLVVAAEPPRAIGRSYAFDFVSRTWVRPTGGRGPKPTHGIETLTYWIEKCVAEGERIWMADGTLRKIEEIRPYDEVLSTDGMSVLRDRVVSVSGMGERECVEVLLKDGRMFRVTSDHLVYGWNGWVPAGALRPWDPVCVLSELPVPDEEQGVPSDDIFLLALWLAEGTKSAYGYEFTNVDEAILGRVGEIAQRRGWALRSRPNEEACYRLSAGGSRLGPGELLQRYGVRAKVDEIAAPQVLWHAPVEAVIDFLSTYISCDGSIEKKCISAVSVSERMARDLQGLCLRLGIRAAVSRLRKQKPHHRYPWQFRVAAASEIQKLGAVLDLIPRKQRSLARLVEEAAQRSHGIRPGGGAREVPPGVVGKTWTSRERALAVVESPTRERITSGLAWMPVRSVRPCGPARLWDIGTERFHCFFAEGGLLHNCLRTDRGAHPVHPAGYGFVRPHPGLIGGAVGQIPADLEVRIREALTFHPRISDVSDFAYAFTDDEDFLSVGFTVALDDDTLIPITGVRMRAVL